MVESEKTAKWQYTRHCEELGTEIKKLREEVGLALLIFGTIHNFTSLYPRNVHGVKLFSCSRWKRSGVFFPNSNSPPSEFGKPSKLIHGNTWDFVQTKGAGSANPKFLSFFSKTKFALELSMNVMTIMKNNMLRIT